MGFSPRVLNDMLDYTTWTFWCDKEGCKAEVTMKCVNEDEAMKELEAQGWKFQDNEAEGVPNDLCPKHAGH